MGDADGLAALSVRVGRCECGGVTYVVNGELRDVVNCHCGRCRRFTGHHMAATSAQLADLEITSAATLQWYEASPGVSYGFCRVCGSSLFWKNDEEPERYSICAGTLDQPSGLTTVKALWMAEFGDYHRPPPGLVECQFDT